jgi:hypothetical protein
LLQAFHLVQVECHDCLCHFRAAWKVKISSSEIMYRSHLRRICRKVMKLYKLTSWCCISDYRLESLPLHASSCGLTAKSGGHFICRWGILQYWERTSSANDIAHSVYDAFAIRYKVQPGSWLATNTSKANNCELNLLCTPPAPKPRFKIFKT